MNIPVHALANMCVLSAACWGVGSASELACRAIPCQFGRFAQRQTAPHQLVMVCLLTTLTALASESSS